MGSYAWKLIITFYHQSIGEKNNLLYFCSISARSKFLVIATKNHELCICEGLLLDKVDRFKINFKIYDSTLREYYISTTE